LQELGKPREGFSETLCSRGLFLKVFARLALLPSGVLFLKVFERLHAQKASVEPSTFRSRALTVSGLAPESRKIGTIPASFFPPGCARPRAFAVRRTFPEGFCTFLLEERKQGNLFPPFARAKSFCRALFH